MTNLALGLGAFRVITGLAGWLSPHPAFTMLGVDVRDTPSGRYMSALYGVRELALGAMTLTGDAPTRRQALVLGAAADVGDTLTNLWSLRRGDLDRPGRAAVVAMTVTLTALGLRALAAERAEYEGTTTA